jgi:hypothetical protein
MGWHKPDPALVWRAVSVYMAHAYDAGGAGAPTGAATNTLATNTAPPSAAATNAPPANAATPHGIPSATPSAVKARLESLRLAPAVGFYGSPVFERDAAASPTKYSLRLGNRHYPHMKLVIERSPDGHGHLFRADTHDAHCRPVPNSRDFHVFNKLMEQNRDVAERIEAAWEQAGVPTFKAYLRQDLARRRVDHLDAD